MSTSSSAAELPPGLADEVTAAWESLRRFMDTGEDRYLTGAKSHAVIERLWHRAIEHPYGARPPVEPRIGAVLAALHWFRFKAGGAQYGDLDRALMMFRSLAESDVRLVPDPAMKLIQEEDEENAEAEQHNAVGVRLIRKFLENGSPAAIADATTMLRLAVDTSVRDSAVRARHLTNLAAAHLTQFNLTHHPAAARDALTAATQATAIGVTMGLDRAAALANHAVVLVQTVAVPGLVDDAMLRSAIDHARGALLSLGNGHPQRASYATTLVSVGRAVFERTGQWSDLHAALSLRAGDRTATADGSTGRPG